MLNYFKLPTKLVLAIFIYWLLQTIADVATLYFSPEYSDEIFNWYYVWAKKSTWSLYVFITSWGVFSWYQHHKITQDNWKKSLLQLILAGVVWVLIFEFYFSWVKIILFGLEKPIWTIYISSLNFYAVYTYFSLLPIVVVANAYYYYISMMQEKADSAELQLKLANTELMLYRAQLEPHFLFNSLNSIASLVRLERKEQATDALNQLSTLLRSVVEIGNNQLMPLQWELEFTRQYIALQTLRFGKKLQVNINVSDLDETTKFPVMLLQPLIENAINHGVLSDSEICEIELTLTVKENYYYLSTRNKIARKKNGNGSGVGLQNMRYRLNALYQNNYELNIHEQNEIFKVEIRFPLSSDRTDDI